MFPLTPLGMKDGQKITFSGEGDQEPGLEPGDMIIVLEEKPNKVKLHVTVVHVIILIKLLSSV